jgi:hypothetical protein
MLDGKCLVRVYPQSRLNVSDCRPRNLDWIVRLNVVWVAPDLSIAHMGSSYASTLVPIGPQNQQDCDLLHKNTARAGRAAGSSGSKRISRLSGLSPNLYLHP